MIGKVAAIAVVALLAIGALTQIFLPGIVASRVESRLEANGGSAKVKVSAFPAVRLLWRSGSRFEATGRGLKIDLRSRLDDPFGQLEGFRDVTIRLDDMRAGVVTVKRFALVRAGGAGAYYLRVAADTTPRDLATAVGRAAGGGLGGALGDFLAGGLPDSGRSDIPISVEGEVSRTPDGRVNADNVTASVAGVPAGPFAEMMVQAVLDRL